MVEAYRYGRVSKEDKEDPERSILNQDTDTLQICQKLGYTDMGYVFDKNISGENLNRPSLDVLKEKAQSGQKFVIIITRADRLGRGQSLLTLLEFFETKNFVTILSIANDIANELQRHTQAFVSGMLIILGRYNYRTMVQRKMMQGLPFFKPPFGYNFKTSMIHGKETSTGEWIVNSEKAKIVRKVFSMFLNDEGYREVCKKLSITPKQYYTILSDGCYTGKIYYHNHIREQGTKKLIRVEEIEYNGVHEPIIPLETFDAAKTKINDKTNKTPKYLEKHGT